MYDIFTVAYAVTVFLIWLRGRAVRVGEVYDEGHTKNRIKNIFNAVFLSILCYNIKYVIFIHGGKKKCILKQRVKKIPDILQLISPGFSIIAKKL